MPRHFIRLAGIICLTVAAPLICRADVCPPDQTTILEMKDVKDVPEDTKGYADLQSLVEHYGILCSGKDGKFRPNDPLRRSDFAVWFNNANDEITSLIDAAINGIKVSEEKKSVAEAELLPDAYLPVDVTTIADVKDIKEGDPGYAALQSLIEQYGMAPLMPDNNFHGADPLTRNALAELCKATLGYVPKSDKKPDQAPADAPDAAPDQATIEIPGQAPIVVPDTPEDAATDAAPVEDKPLTRLEAAIYLNRALAFYEKRITAAAEELSKEAPTAPPDM